MTLGVPREAFTPTIKAGENSLWAWPIMGARHARRNRVLQSRELTILDVGSERDHGVGDFGRILPVGRRFSPRHRDLVEMVRRVSDAVIATANPGVTLRELQTIAEATIPVEAGSRTQAPACWR